MDCGWWYYIMDDGIVDESRDTLYCSEIDIKVEEFGGRRDGIFYFVRELVYA